MDLSVEERLLRWPSHEQYKGSEKLDVMERSLRHGNATGRVERSGDDWLN